MKNIKIIAFTLLLIWITPAAAHDFSYLNLLLANLKLSAQYNSEDATEYCLKVTEYNNMIRAKEGIAWQGYLTQAQSKLKNILADFDEKEDFTISTITSLGEFNAATMSFAPDITPRTEFYPTNPPDPSQANKKLFLVFTNTLPLSEVKVSAEAAQEILKSSRHLAQLKITAKLTKGFKDGKNKGVIKKYEVLSEDGSKSYVTFSL